MTAPRRFATKYNFQNHCTMRKISVINFYSVGPNDIRLYLLDLCLLAGTANISSKEESFICGIKDTI